MNQGTRQINSPWLSLVILLGFTVFLAFLTQLLVVGIDLTLRGDILEFLSAGGVIEGGFDRPVFLYALMATGTIGTFFLPALALQQMEKYATYFPKRRQDVFSFLLIIAFLFAFAPFMQLIADWNAQLELPKSWSGIEEWMKSHEDSSSALIAKMVMVDHIGMLLVNILVMAVFPAIAEEFYFRGSLMQIVQRMTNNHHVTIWLIAIIFSAIHMQFYGFLPRMLLGAFFGYALAWTQNIWVPIVGHFVNNATVTIVAFNYARQGKSYDELQQSETYTIYIYVGSLLLTCCAGYWFYYQTKKRQINGERLG